MVHAYLSEKPARIYVLITIDLYLIIFYINFNIKAKSDLVSNISHGSVHPFPVTREANMVVALCT